MPSLPADIHYNKDFARHYVAFSIHGTNKFIMAYRETKPLSKAFTPVPSRFHTGTVAAATTKYHWSGLAGDFRNNDNAWEAPKLTDPKEVLRAFRRLAKCGWTLHPEKLLAFKKHHGIR